MADLDPLIKFRKHRVDEKQKVLAQLYREAEELEQQKQATLDQMEKERALTEQLGTPDAMTIYNRYADGARRKIKALDSQLEKLDIRIGAAQEAMREAFAEMKKVEITQRNRKSREQKARDKKDEQELDEMAIEGHRRKNQE